MCIVLFVSMRILAFSTTTDLCSVALMVDQHIYHYDIIMPRCHAEKILFMVDQLLSETGVILESLDCIVFDKGPGNFVGMRIGASVAQGLVLGADLPLVEVSSLIILAQGAWRVFGAKRVITTIDARMGELYWANYYRVVDNYWMCENEEILVTENFTRKLIDSLQGSWVLVGTGWNNFSTLKYVSIEDSIVLRSVMFPCAQDILPIGIYKWKNKLFVTPNCIKLMYLRDNRVYLK